ncbi:hypothetical protein [Halopiger aswanensis]|uniref:Uncharacterized protein n=1 Tax=Halopiger aswanensis TaxID=148449 RepID=A0A3R7ECS6_9EURY|nr:hypothetical protein [Halopiger aswanensis]RKD89207.1 hypothetical protein ATJ93_4034 [Halopiger aswanensis]
MSTIQRAPVPEPVRQGLGLIQNSVSLVILAMGVLLLLTGFIIQTGVWAAIFAVWGTALTIVGATAYAIVWWSYQ